MVLSDDRIDAMVWDLLGNQETPRAEPGPSLALLKQREQEHAAQKIKSLNGGMTLRLEKLRYLFQLSEFEIGVIVICLASELDLRYEILYAYLQEDVNKKQPTVNLALRVLSKDLIERVGLRRSFVNSAPLSKYSLVHLSEDPYNREPQLLSRIMKLDSRITDYLLDSDNLDFPLHAWTRLAGPTTQWSEVVAPAEVMDQLQSLIEGRGNRAAEPDAILQLLGPEGTGKRTVAQALSTNLGRDLIIVDSAGLLASDLTPESAMSHTFREARLRNAVLCVSRFHLLSGEDSRAKALQASFIKAVEEQPGLSIITGETRWRPSPPLERHGFMTVELRLPEYSDRELLWRKELGKHPNIVTADQVSSLVSKFRFTGGQIQQTVATAAGMARWRSEDSDLITSDDLNAASRWQSNHRLELLAQRIFPRYSWEDIVLPSDQKLQLWEVCKCFENMPLVYGTWGFQSKTTLGKGLNVLFAGPSGTGKTMAAEIMAGQLELDIYKIDLSSIVSKYIGETEKNLDRIFSEAQDSNAILFFDEADAVFGKRSEVRDAHDRYANIEVSYLLQKMEEYQGITILTTNFRKNMDDAFVRRLHYAVEFPFPEEEYRLLIWQRVFPEAAPVDPLVDLSFLARQFKVTGGNIKNIAVTAAFLAAQEEESIKMEHVIQAVKREYQKMGKLLVESDFQHYYELVSG